MSVEGGIRGSQQRFVCPHCGMVFFAWRPDTAPGQKFKCYFCKKEMEDDAARRVAPPPPAPASTVPAAPADPAAPAPPPTPTA